MRSSFLVALLGIALYGTPGASQEKKNLPAGAVQRLGVERQTIRWPLKGVFTVDEKRLVVVKDVGKNKVQRNIALVDAVSGQEVRRIDFMNAVTATLAAGKPLLAAANAERIELWDLEKDQRLRRWQHPSQQHVPTRLAVAPDGSRVVAVFGYYEMEFLLWDSTRDEPVTHQRPGFIDDIMFAPDGKTFLLIGDRHDYFEGNQRKLQKARISVHDAATGAKQSEQLYDFYRIRLSPCITKAAGYDARARELHLVDLKPKGKDSTVLPIPGPENWAFTPDGKNLIVHDRNSNVWRWDIDRKEATRLFQSYYGPQGAPDNRFILAWDQDYWLQRWDMKTGKLVRYQGGFPGGVHGLAYSPDGKRLAGFSLDTILIFDPATGRELQQWRGHDDRIQQIAFSPDGKLLASASVDATIALWDHVTGKEQRRLKANAPVHTMAFSANGRTLTAVAEKQQMQMWEVDSGQLIGGQALAQRLDSPLLSPNAQYLAGFEPDRLKKGYERPGSPLFLLGGLLQPEMDFGDRTPYTVAFSQDSTLMATSSGKVGKGYGYETFQYTIQVWDTATRTELAIISDNPVFSSELLAISPDKRLLVHGIGPYHESALRFHDLTREKRISLAPAKQDDRDWIARWARGEEFLQLTTHHRHNRYARVVKCLTFSPDGKHLATGGEDGIIYIWDVAHFLK